MLTLTTSFWLPQWVLDGLQDAKYERAGSIIRDVTTKQIICWLRDQPFIDDAWEVTDLHPFLTILFSTSTADALKDQDLMNFLRFVHAVPVLVDLDFYGGRVAMGQILATTSLGSTLRKIRYTIYPRWPG